MCSSVELRVPFLDLEFIELAERMPSRYKVSQLGERKWLYRSMARRILPRRTAARLCGIPARLRRKQGFSTPMSVWSSFGEQRGPIGELIDWRRVRAEDSGFGVRQRVALASLSAWSTNAA
jgi:asparagine synthase (glutamine-hydrolysing)